MSAASDYEYRDIAMESVDAAGESGRGRRRRILLDTDFRAQFEIPPLRQQYTFACATFSHSFRRRKPSSCRAFRLSCPRLSNAQRRREGWICNH
jgi:hypothetical protein